MNDVAKVLLQAMGTLEEVDQTIAGALTTVEPADLRAGFKEVLVDLLHKALEDPSGLMKRRVKIQMMYLIERFSEVLQDQVELGVMTKGSEFMRWIDKAHVFAARIASAKDASFIEDYDVDVRPVSILDPVTPEEREARKANVRDQFRNFLRNST